VRSIIRHYGVKIGTFTQAFSGRHFPTGL
jgi:hypothetical protein